MNSCFKYMDTPTRNLEEVYSLVEYLLEHIESFDLNASAFFFPGKYFRFSFLDIYKCPKISFSETIFRKSCFETINDFYALVALIHVTNFVTIIYFFILLMDFRHF